jgi:hypothetical protein
VNPNLKGEPSNDIELFDMLHSLFGIGDWEEGTPWWRHRANEIAKLRGIRKRRSITLADFALTARYCYRHKEKVTESWQLCGFIADAKREARRIAVPDLSRQVSEAIASERALPGPDSDTWIERLLLTRGPFRQEVLDQWRAERIFNVLQEAIPGAPEDIHL